MMQQYLDLKQKYPDCLLLFRLGDFYELFLDDALLGSELLDITLTARPRGKDGDIPMAGVPYHSLDNYIHKLTAAGHKVAICEQISPPDGRTLVEREVVRIISPGNVVTETALSASEHSYILCLYHQTTDQAKKRTPWAVGLADISTGTLRVSEASSSLSVLDTLSELISKYQPREMIVERLDPTDQINRESVRVAKKHGLAIFSFSQWSESVSNPAAFLKSHFQVRSLKPLDLDGKKAAQAVTSLLIHYIEYMQQATVSNLQAVQPLLSPSHMQLDRSTITNLELLQTLYDGKRAGSLLQVIDQTKTALGARLLREWLIAPLIDQSAIEARLESVQWFHQTQAVLAQARQTIREVRDIERITARLTLNQGSPKDLMALAQSLSAIENLLSLFTEATTYSRLPNLLKEHVAALSDPKLRSLKLSILSQLVEDPPFDPKQGGLIQAGVDEELDELRTIAKTNRTWMAEFEQQQKAATNITTLKVRYNKVFGFYIEISKSYLDQVPAHYIRRQTLVNAERFITPEMKEREDQILTAQETSQAIEYRLFLDLVNQMRSEVAALQAAAQAIAVIDCLMSFAQHALDAHYCKPILTTDRVLELTQSRHPVVETLLDSHAFVPNDLQLHHDQRQLLLLTGPNMAGKSVLMRQVALITLMAQIGSYVPAKAARIGVVDRIFVRSGASDVISDGLSTFMVEMTETAAILSKATDSSLVIMDEIGRGTSTFDGISIAWAIAEFLAGHGPVRPLTLFATHYHELQALADQFPKRVDNAHMAVSREENQPVFLYQLKAGGAGHSFGIDVATLAGVPRAVTTRATELLARFESDQTADLSLSKPSDATTPTIQSDHVSATVLKPLGPDQPIENTPSLFGEMYPEPSKSRLHSQQQKILQALRTTSLETTTPLEALNLLAKLKAQLHSD